MTIDVSEGNEHRKCKWSALLCCAVFEGRSESRDQGGDGRWALAWAWALLGGAANLVPVCRVACIGMGDTQSPSHPEPTQR
jgi:hypothetical protein